MSKTTIEQLDEIHIAWNNLKREVKTEVKKLFNLNFTRKMKNMTDDELNETFFKEAGTKKEETKNAFRKLIRQSREDALTLLREKKKKNINL
jgi:hypothetical protein